MNWLLQRRRTAAYVLGTVAAVAILLLFGTVRLLVAASAYGAEVERLRPRIARLEGLTEIEDRIDGQRTLAEGAVRELVYPASDDPSALAASLQAEIRRTFVSAGMNVTNSQVLPVDSEGGFDRISIKVTCTGGIDDLDAGLRDFAALRPRLLIESMDVFPSRARDGSQTQNLSVVMQLAALRVSAS